jgi:PAS domain S-box-containing protein
METSNFRSLLRRTLAVPLVLLALLAVMLVLEVLSLTYSLRLVEHTNEVIGSSRLAMRHMVEMESSVRGFELTRDKAFLTNFERNKQELPASIDELVQLTSDNQLQQNRLKDIRDLDKGWIEWAQQELERHAMTAPSDSELLFGARLMEEIRTRQREVVDEESRLLLQRSSRANLLGRVVVATVAVLLFIIVFVLLKLTRQKLDALVDSYEGHIKAEAEQSRQLQENREWFRITLNSLVEGVIATDAHGLVTFLNPVAQKLTGWTDLEALGRPVAEVFRVMDEQTRTIFANPMDSFVGTEGAGGSPTHVAVSDRNRYEFPVELNAAPILNDRSERVGSVIVFRDVTQRRQTEHTLLVSERLTQAGRLSATIAHEIRNPLDTVANLIYLLQHEKNAGVVSQQYLQMAAEELARITQITGQLLTFHREARHPVDVSIREVLESVLTLFAPQIRKCKIRIDKRLETSARIRGFPGELRQVFSNLVGNAVDAMPSGGTLVIRARESSLADNPSRKGVRITILDTGSGISLGIKRNLFAPFYTTKGEKGTGLGLWVSRGIVEKHEGTIHVISSVREGRSGTAFSVFLPFQQMLGKLDGPRVMPTTHA